MYLFLTAYLLLAIPSAAAVLRQKQTPVVAIAWLLAIVLLPIGGSLFYLLAGYRKPVRDVPPTDSRPAAGIERLVRRFDGMVVLDEAYIDFAAGPGFLARLGEFENLIVLQTLSKAWGMAGLRLGLAFASDAVVALFARVKYPYNINCLAQEAVAERLAQDVSPQVARLCAERERLLPALAACPAIERVYPSDANFILVRTPRPDRMYDALIAAGVIVRNRSRIPGCEGCLRITVGTPAENARMLETVKNFRL